MTDRPYHLFTEDHDQLRKVVRDLLESRVTARAAELEETNARDVVLELGRLGYLEADPVAAAVVAEELGATGVYGVAAAAISHVAARLAAGSPAASHEQLCAFAASEPHLDPGAIAATARREGGSVLVTGTKSFVPVADRIVTTAMLDGAPALLAVEGATFEVQDVIGWWSCPLGIVELADTRAELLASDAGDIIERIASWQNLCEAFALTGLARCAVDTGIAYGLERSAFDRPVAKFQVWRHRWADHATDLEMSHALATQALRLTVHGEPSARAVASARVFAGRAAFAAADQCLQMHGGYGYMMEFQAQRFWRDARQATVVRGGDHVLLETIARDLGL